MSNNFLSFLNFYFLIIPAITSLLPPSVDFSSSGRTPNAPNRSPSSTIVCISASLQLKEEGDLHREDRGGMIMGLYIGGGDMMMMERGGMVT